MGIKDLFRIKTNQNKPKTEHKTVLGYSREYDEVNFRSTSKEGLDKLIEFYKGAKESCNPELREKFFNKIMISNFTITDVAPDHLNIPIGELNANVDYGMHEVYFSKDIIEGKKYSVFYHEFGHIIDFKAERFKKSFNKLDEVFKDFAPGFSNKKEYSNLLFGCFSVFQVEYNEFIEKTNKKMESDSIKVKINDRATRIYRKKCDSEEFDNKLYNELKYEAYYYYKDCFCRESGLNSISDIFDALTMGRLSSSDIPIGNKKLQSKKTGEIYINSIYYGHSSEYFSDKEACSKEIIADVSALCSAGNKDLLYKYFPEEIANGLIEAYKDLLNYEPEKVDDSNLGEIVDIYESDSINKRGAM